MVKYLQWAAICASLCFFILWFGCSPPERYHLRPIIPTGSLEEYEGGVADASAQRLYELGWLYLQKGRTRIAKDVFTRLIEQVPDEADAYFYLGVAQAKEHEKTEAILSFRRALDLRPGLADAHWALALLYNERGDGYQDALAAAEEGLNLDLANAYGHFVSGFILCSRGENERAEQLLLKAVELDPQQAHANYYLALLYLRKQDDEKAIVAMEHTVEADPSYTAAYYSLGTLYARTGRIEDGQRMIDFFQQLSGIDMEEDHYHRQLYRSTQPLLPEQQAAGHFNLGLVYLKRGELDRAQRQFQAALSVDSTYAEAQHNIGVIYALKGKHVEALAHFSSAVSIKPDYALAHKNLGNSYLVQGEYQRAEQSFRSALGLDVEMIEGLNGLGTALIQQGRIEEGRIERDRAVELAAKKRSQ
ncbi:MAG: protein O-GlcNAc transferase [Planctomycetota bacterium]|jgi:protein O-GlcNAc transferase